MAVTCNCVECGGDDPFQICDNKLLKIQGEVARFKRRTFWLILTAWLVVGAGVVFSL